MPVVTRTLTRLLPSLLAAATLLCADRPKDKPGSPVSGEGSDPRVAIKATAYYDRDQVKSLLGMDPGESIVVVEVTFTPAQGEDINLNLDDFLLRSDRDGQKSRPLEPTQIAGSAVMVVKSQGGTQGTGMSQQRRVPYGVPGIPGGGGPMGQSLPMPNEAPNSGTATADTSSAVASIEDRNIKKNPLLDLLKARVLTDGQVNKPITGLLYFQMEGKLRPKDLELVYRKAPPRVSVRFVPVKKK